MQAEVAPDLESGLARTAALAREAADALGLTTLGLTACASDPASPAARAADAPSFKRDRESPAAGAVYTMTNATTGNQILAFHRAADGTLSPLGAFPTGGTGIGGAIDPLHSQYAVILSDDHRLLFAVDAGSNTVASFRVADDGALSLADRGTSGGTSPVSLALSGRLLYVLNTGDNVVHGYRAAASGHLAPPPGSTRALGAGAAGASTIHFAADGRALVVTERLSNRIETFPVLPNGRLGAPVVTASAAATPFGFDVVGSTVLVADATFMGQEAAVSSYQLGAGATLAVRTAALDVGAQGACRLVATADGRYAYSVNSPSASLTAIAVGPTGAIALVHAPGPVVSTGTGSTPLEPALSSDDAFLYVLKAGSGTIGAFRVGADHGLTAAAADTRVGAPGSAVEGLAAF